MAEEKKLHWIGIIPHRPQWGEENLVFGPDYEVLEKRWSASRQKVCQHPKCHQVLPLGCWEKDTHREEWKRLFPAPYIKSSYPKEK